ncbi:MAG: hypothetical protein EOO99_07515 [Pedobacter sp.]|nr:MAG: hypothetical protein EOO99_07515 [Pedobacter sp.]
MKTFVLAALVSILVLISISVTAQSNYYKMSGEAGVGTNYLYGDASKIELRPQFHLAYEYHAMRFIALGLKTQFGSTAGSHQGSSFTNSFINYQLYAKANLGMFIPKFDLERPFWKYTHGFFGGIGLGGQSNNRTERGQKDFNGSVESYIDKAKSGSVFILGTTGYDYFIKDKDEKTRWAVSLNYQFVIALDDDLDGAFRNFQRSNYNDFNNTISLGVRYYFGPFGLDKNR